ncbi:LysR family transcriptional regulator [Neorhizobium lilium]|uniref:LysR family transcriptional regulator n=1 Tax=Neorhizobium lilium TaxID=2503024 RepID=A0A3S3RLT5_9HYPH|nr:LysR family transcriptional regulator [Neorhizobium lilium]RWX81619.1 LysR family transcriptional regulator [Neorhizobium lilium]
MYKFDLIDLKIFVAAVDRGSLSAAAAANNIVVAAVSTRLKRLEKAFNLELFERTGRGIRPTLAGDMFARQARKVLDDARRIDVELDAFAEGHSGTVRLLSNTNMLSEHMPQALGPFLQQNPDIFLSVKDKPSHEVVNLLKDGEADIGIVAASADMSELQRWRFVSDRLVLIVPTNVLMEGPTSFSSILDYPVIALQEKVALSQFLRRLANELGRRPNIRFRCESFEALCHMVSFGAGVGIVPESAAERYGQRMAFQTFAIVDAWAERELYICVRNEAQLPGFARKLLEHLLIYVHEYNLRPA